MIQACVPRSCEDGILARAGARVLDGFPIRKVKVVSYTPDHADALALRPEILWHSLSTDRCSASCQLLFGTFLALWFQAGASNSVPVKAV